MVSPAPPDAGTLTANGSNSSHPNIRTSPLLFLPRKIYNQIHTFRPRAGDASELSSMDPPPAHDLGPLTTNENKSSLTTTPQSPLLSLPRELRDDIFAPLLRAGSVAILRTSKQIHDEARERLFHEAVFRVKVGFAGGRVNSFPTNWKKFESFHFRIFVGTGSTLPAPPTFRLFDRFADLDGTNLKRECLISIEYEHYNGWGCLCQYEYPLSLSGKIASLITFTTVVVEFVPKGTWEQWQRERREDTEPWDEDDMIADKWTVLEEQLRPGLGTGRLDCVRDGEQRIIERRLVFHPRQYHSSLAGDGAGVLVKD